MTEKDKRQWSNDGLERLIGALEGVSQPPAGPHLTVQQFEAFVAGQLDERENAAACAHMSSCEACAIEADSRFETQAACVVTPVKQQGDDTTTVVGSETKGKKSNRKSPKPPGRSATQGLIFQPFHPREPMPGCVEPLELAARFSWPGINIRVPQHRLFSEALPEPKIVRGVCPLIVTTAFRAAYEYQRGNDWSVVIPLALAPRDTRIVITRGSPLDGLADYRLAANLGGKRIAVADPTSAYAGRLASAAAHFGITAVIDQVAEPRDPDTLYLQTMPFALMPEALRNKDIDGFATVEPFPTIAELLYLRSAYAEVVLGERSTSTSTAFCCVVIAPRRFVEEPRFAKAYEALVRALFASVCRVLKDADLEVSQRIRPTANPSSGFDIGRRAALAMLRHLSEGLRFDNADARSMAEKLADQFVPDVTEDSLNADFATLCRFLSRDEQRNLREAFRRRPYPRPLYMTDRLREICRDVIAAEFGEDTDIAQKLADVEKEWNTFQAAAAVDRRK